MDKDWWDDNPVAAVHVEQQRVREAILLHRETPIEAARRPGRKRKGRWPRLPYGAVYAVWYAVRLCSLVCSMEDAGPLFFWVSRLSGLPYQISGSFRMLWP